MAASFEPEVDREFLNIGYNLKVDADYEVGPDTLVTEDASAATAMADRLLTKNTSMLTAASATPQTES